MSNPLLKPNDPRFTKPALTDDAGQNRFAEPGEAKETPTATPGDGNLFAVGTATAATTDKPYQPRYETTSRSRGVQLLIVAILGLGGLALGTASLTGMIMVGWALPICGAVASGTAWLLAHQDLQAMQTGAVDSDGRQLTLLAMWLGIAGLIACVGTAAGMIWLGLDLLPKL